eukprot:m.357643 g.357643  ORF g.357643 m.357643 type:complete len:75 (+) comp17888_c0_seq1:2160-2384(+)
MDDSNLHDRFSSIRPLNASNKRALFSFWGPSNVPLSLCPDSSEFSLFSECAFGKTLTVNMADTRVIAMGQVAKK